MQRKSPVRVGSIGRTREIVEHDFGLGRGGNSGKKQQRTQESEAESSANQGCGRRRCPAAEVVQAVFRCAPTCWTGCVIAVHHTLLYPLVKYWGTVAVRTWDC